MRILKKIYYFLVFSNLLIALAAYVQCGLTYLILNKSPNSFVLAIEGTATLLLYNFSILLSKPKKPQESPYLRTRWIFKNEWLLWTTSILAFGLLTYALMQVHMYTLLFLAGIGMLSLGYTLPLFKINGVRSGLRQLPGLKLFHIALIWSLSSVGLPVIQLWAEGNQLDWYSANYLGIAKIIFLLLCTLPFDIRDIRQDSYYHLKTIPNMLGEKKAIRLCYILVLIHSVLVLCSPYDNGIVIGLFLTNLIVVLAMRFVIFQRIERYHYVYLLDMALIVQFLICGLTLYIV
ncbi:hypothetical protein FAZ19_13735 [Sphingobacterium alkalisoli]|uniref:Prenyltransferase n=1 Tax=Sphingobacterium alkalisoli TaxID=1874115 RepID=A0A4V5LXX2_9SPHI|nr:hypothetical protein [Sphingobacterium alkalisoli]TJY64269.1 hypothetical protein FAZ19_13735 [Sphingobacterium alkalisoli]GGH22789.1 hypothetical protein GCM10011418_29600 [Sphingobacterium alkalisoli]